MQLNAIICLRSPITGPAPLVPQFSTVSPTLQHMIESLPNPAYVKTLRWDLGFLAFGQRYSCKTKYP
jgi:hypothetical protein